MLRVVFIGTRGEFTLQPLRAILAAHVVVAIVQSAPRDGIDDAPSPAERIADGLGALTGRPSLKTIAQRRGIPFLRLTPRNLPELRTLLAGLQPDVGCIASMNQLLPEDCFSLPRQGFINFHPSLLPRFRGPNVWFWQYHEMDTQGGATIIRIDRGEDTGEILRQESFPVPLGLPPERLQEQAIALGTRLTLATLDDLETGRATPRSQRDLPCSVRARYLRDGDELFAWEKWTPEQTFHFLRGTEPWYTALSPEHGWLGHLDWRATGFTIAPPSTSSGKIRLDRCGAYFAHPGGKIRLRPRRILWRILLLTVLVVAVARLW